MAFVKPNHFPPIHRHHIMPPHDLRVGRGLGPCPSAFGSQTLRFHSFFLSISLVFLSLLSLRKAAAWTQPHERTRHTHACTRQSIYSPFCLETRGENKTATSVQRGQFLLLLLFFRGLQPFALFAAVLPWRKTRHKPPISLCFLLPSKTLTCTTVTARHPFSLFRRKRAEFAPLPTPRTCPIRAGDLGSSPRVPEDAIWSPYLACFLLLSF
jgi:hypothetical protein